ncbi:MAG: tetratricopeptide repeat protein [Anaerolineales bacterium]|nr:tetratricopeptide repeat protein [Anaerolineales bacterium]
MPKSKHNRKNKRTNKGGARPKNRLPEGLQLRAFTIKDEIDYSYQPGIPDELAEATIMLREGRVKEAKTAFERIIEREPRAREAYLNLAVAHIRLGDETTAETLMRQTLDKFPNYAMARINLARTYLHRRQLKEAKEMLLPLDETKQFTSVEFQNYAATWSDILKAEGNSDAAESWKRMLYDVMLKNPGMFR